LCGLCAGPCEWISLSILPSPILELQHAPLPLKVLWARERIPTPPSVVFHLDSHSSPSRSWECVTPCPLIMKCNGHIPFYHHALPKPCLEHSHFFPCTFHNVQWFYYIPLIIHGYFTIVLTRVSLDRPINPSTFHTCYAPKSTNYFH
jgi:hypothetical protein